MALRLDDKSSSQSSDYENLCKAVDDLSTKSTSQSSVYENLCKAVDDLSTKSTSQSSVYENLCKAVDDLSIKIDQLNSSEKILQQRIMDTTTALSSSNPSLNAIHSPSSVATNIVKELADRKHRKTNLIFYNVPEPSTPSWKADSDFIVDLCKATYDLNIHVIKAFHLGKKITNKHRPLLIRLSDSETKSKILSKSYLLRSKSPYDVSVDRTKAEQAKHKLLVDELKTGPMEKQTSSFKVTILLLGMDLNGNLTLQKQQMRYLDLWILPDNNPEFPENSTYLQ